MNSKIVSILILSILLVIVAGSLLFFGNKEEVQPITNTYSTQSERTETTATQIDKEPPQIINAKIIETKPNSITIYWETDELATGQIEYWSWDNSSQSIKLPENKTLSKVHLFTVTNLFPNVEYTFKIMSKDASGNEGYTMISQITPTPPLSFHVEYPGIEMNGVLPSPYFSWSESAFAEKYIVEIATSPEFGNSTIYRKEVSANNLSYVLDKKLDVFKKYYYRIVAVNEWGNTTALETPSWFTTALPLESSCLACGVKSIAFTPDGSKAIIVYDDGELLSVISLRESPKITANLTLPVHGVSVDIATTYDSKYAVIVERGSKSYVYVLDLNTNELKEVSYVSPLAGNIILGTSNVITSLTDDTAYLFVDILNPVTIKDYTDYVISVLDIPTAKVIDYIHTFESSSLSSSYPIVPYGITPDGRSLYAGYHIGTFNVSGKIVNAGFVEKINLATKTITNRTIFALAGYESGPWDMVLTPDGVYGLVLMDEKAGDYYGPTLLWWNIPENRITGKLRCEHASLDSSTLRITVDGKYLLVRGEGSSILLISVQDKKILQTYYSYKPLTESFAVSPDGKIVLFGSYDRLGIIFLN